MNNVLNQSGKVLEEALAGSNSDDVETTFRGQRNFKIAVPLFANSWKASCQSSVTLSHTV